MFKSYKATLLSVLVFPGVGHFSLKKPVQGLLLLIVSIVCLYFLLTITVELVQQLSVKIQSGEIPMDVAKISDIVLQQIVDRDDQRINMPSLVLLICWVLGVVDSFRIEWLRSHTDDLSNKKT